MGMKVIIPGAETSVELGISSRVPVPPTWGDFVRYGETEYVVDKVTYVMRPSLSHPGGYGLFDVEYTLAEQADEEDL